MNWSRLKLFVGFLVKPLVVITNVSTKVANWSVTCRNSFNFLWGNHKKIALRSISRSNLAIWVTLHLLVENILNFLCLSNIDVALGCCINYLWADVPTLTKWNFGWSKIWLNIEINESPMLKKSMQSDNWADISRQLFAALSCWKVSAWIFSVHLYDQVSKVQISFWILVRELVAEKFRQSLHFELVNQV